MLSSFECPGHFGHIGLPSPVFHPLFMVHMHKILRGSCLYCHRFRAPDEVLVKFWGALQFLEYGMVQQADAITLEHPRGLSAADLLADASDVRSRKDKEENTLTQDDGDAGQIKLQNKEQDRETVAQFVERMRSHVLDTINAYLKDNPYSRAQNQDNATFDRRKELIRTFLGEINRRKRCPHCQAYVLFSSRLLSGRFSVADLLPSSVLHLLCVRTALLRSSRLSWASVTSR